MNADFWQFAWAHPFLVWLLAWGIWPVCWMLQAVLTAPFSFAFRAYARRQRAHSIHTHGWPTNPLMDADGDIVHPPVPEVASK